MATDAPRDPVSRAITIDVDVIALDKMRKEGTTADGFTVYCDEAERTGGDNSAPSPMRYFCLSIGF